MNLVVKIINSEFFSYLVVYFGFLALSVEVFTLDYRLGVSIAYVLAVSFHFLANRKFTFRIVDDRVIHQWMRYLGVLIINYLIMLSIVSFFVDKLGISTYFSAAISIVVTVSVGYLASKFWVFRNKESLRD